MTNDSPTLDQLAQQVAELQRKDAGVDIPYARDYFESVAQRQAQQFLVRRERARLGHEARERIEKTLKSRRHRAEDELAKINRERTARLEQHERTRLDLIERYSVLEAKPKEALAAIQAEVQQAGEEAEAKPVEVDPPKVTLGIDYSDTLGSAPIGGWR